MTTIYDATIKGPVVALMGKSRVYAIGDVAYRFKRPTFPDGSRQTLPLFARGIPVTYVDDKWQETQLARPIIVNWNREITVLD